MDGFFDARFLLTAALCLAVIFVNGWTDAPNSVATAIASGALRWRTAINLSAVFNFLGVAAAYAFNDSLSRNIGGAVDFGKASLCVLCAAMTSVVAFAVIAWYFGIPTSESHALMAALAGGAAALGRGDNTRSLLGGTFLGIAVTSAMGFLLALLIKRLLKKVENTALLKNGQVASAAALSFIHGAQDGQKFAAILLLSLKTAAPERAYSPFFAVAVCALLMSLGTAVGGGRIIKKVGSGIARVDPRGGLACDVSAFIALSLCTLLGIPASTTHTKTTAVLGVGVEEGGVNLRTFGGIAAAWALTFPCCFAISFSIVKICT